MGFVNEEVMPFLKDGARLSREAEKVLPSGVSSPVRALSAVHRDPLIIQRGVGSRVYDADAKEYIDYVLSFGAHILGHAHPVVIKAVQDALRHGFSFGATTGLEIALAKELVAAIPWIDQVRFVNSGTEAAMSALRLARGVTGRDTVVKFRHAYHGHADSFLVEAGSACAAMSTPSSAGVPLAVSRHTLVAEYGDTQMLEEVFREHGADIAAVIVEPVGGNYGVILPDALFLRELRAITQQYGALLIFDEVITGFRFRYGALADSFGVIPDLVCLGKIIGGGLPIGAYAGKERLMQHLAPRGEVYQASTFAGNPVVMQAGLTTLQMVSKKREKYAVVSEMAESLKKSILFKTRDRGIEVETKAYGGMFSFSFKERELFAVVYNHLLEEGVFFAPSEYEVNFLSFAHTWDDIDKTQDALKKCIGRL